MHVWQEINNHLLWIYLTSTIYKVLKTKYKMYKIYINKMYKIMYKMYKVQKSLLTTNTQHVQIALSKQIAFDRLSQHKILLLTTL